MIFRYYTLCPGCEAKIVLRLGVGIDEYEPFYYVCDKCGAANRGALKINYDTDPPSTELILEGQEPMEPDTYFDVPDQITTISLDLPCVLTGDKSPETQSPFIHQSILMGETEKLLQFQNRIGIFRATVKSDWVQFKRLITYYTDRNWKQFDAQWKSIFEDKAPIPKNEFQRHDLFHSALDILFIPLLPEFDYLILKKEFSHFITKLTKEKIESLKYFSLSLTSGKELAQYQRALLERLAFVVDNFSALSPGFPVLFYNPDGKKDLSQLRIMRDDFEILKVHYLSCFEICHKILSIVIGLQNIDARELPDSFDTGKPTSLKEFSELPNAKKARFLDKDVLPQAHARWNDCFDRKLRNSIGHNNIYHDLRTGMLVIGDNPSTPYSEFVANTLNLLPMLLYCLHVVKMMYICQHLLK